MTMKAKAYSGGLVLTRKLGEAIYIRIKERTDQVIRIDVRELTKSRVHVGIMADAELVEIVRAEVVHKDKEPKS